MAGRPATHDLTSTDPELYRTVMENDRVRVLEDRDRPGDATSAHRHPDNVMITVSSFTRRVWAGGRQVDIALPAGEVRWVPAQEHRGENIGDTGTHVYFVGLNATSIVDGALGPTDRTG